MMNYNIEILGQGTLIFKEKKAQEIGRKLIEIYDNPNSIMGKTTPPQIAYFPKFLDKSSKDAVHYLMNLAMFDSQCVSEILYSNVCKTVTKGYEQGLGFIFDPSFIIQFKDQDEVQNYYENLGLEISPFIKYKNLLKNAKTILEKFDGDVRNLVINQNRRTLETELTIIKEFKGLGVGTTPLFLKYCMQRNLINFLDPEKLLVKVDVHKLRFPFAMNLFEFEEIQKDSLTTIYNTETTLIPGFQKIYKYMAKSNASNNKEAIINMQKIDETVWRIGTDICREKSIPYCNFKCPLINSCTGLPFHLSGNSTPKKRKKKLKFIQNSLFEDEEYQQHPERRNLHINNQKVELANGEITYADGWRSIMPNIDCRTNKKTKKLESKLIDKQENLFF